MSSKGTDLVKRDSKTLPVKIIPSSPEIKYLHIAIVVSALAIGGYCSLEYVRQGLIEYLVGAVIGGLFFVASSLWSIAGKAVPEQSPQSLIDQSLPQQLLSHKLFKKYQVILSDIEGFDSHKRSLLNETVTGQLKELIESRLPRMLSRRDSYRQYWKRCNPEKLEGEVKELKLTLQNEKDDDIKKVIKRNLSIAESTDANYEKIRKALKLYDLQIATVGQHLENLDTKIHILELESDMHDAAKDVIEEITGDINDIEETLSQMDLPAPQ